MFLVSDFVLVVTAFFASCERLVKSFGRKVKNLLLVSKVLFLVSKVPFHCPICWSFGLSTGSAKASIARMVTFPGPF